MSQEIYALGENRTAFFAERFLDRFLPNRAPYADDFPVPESSDNPEVVHESVGDLLIYLEKHPQEPYGIYWNSKDPDSYDQAMLFYTRDGKVIFGLACEESEAEARARELKEFVGATYLLMSWEQRPPELSSDFIALCARNPN